VGVPCSKISQSCYTTGTQTFRFQQTPQHTPGVFSSSKALHSPKSIAEVNYKDLPYRPSWCAALGTGAIKTSVHIEDIKFVSNVRHISCQHASRISSPSTKLHVLSSFRRDVFENCALLGYYIE
jgi:hypothetical protein